MAYVKITNEVRDRYDIKRSQVLLNIHGSELLSNQYVESGNRRKCQAYRLALISKSF